MLCSRSKEEVLQLQEEMKRFEAGLRSNKEILEEVFEKDHKSENILLRGKAYIMQTEIKRLARLLDDCNVWFRGAVSAFSRNNVAHIGTNDEDESDYATDSESTDDAGESLSEDEADFCENDCENDNERSIIQ